MLRKALTCAFPPFVGAEMVFCATHRLSSLLNETTKNRLLPPINWARQRGQPASLGQILN
jgi:hypothetical protein